VNSLPTGEAKDWSERGRRLPTPKHMPARCGTQGNAERVAHDLE
jgi:hypothetical protein